MENIKELRALKKEIYILYIYGPRSTILAGPTTGSAPEYKE